MKQLQDDVFAARFEKAGEAWDIALQLSALRKKSGLSLKELAWRLGTSLQQISRLESPQYEEHFLSMLCRVAEVLGVRVHIELLSGRRPKSVHVAEKQARYGARKK